jgi:hypothetical protein
MIINIKFLHFLTGSYHAAEAIISHESFDLGMLNFEDSMCHTPLYGAVLSGISLKNKSSIQIGEYGIVKNTEIQPEKV